MLFNSLSFLVFFPLVTLVFFVVPKKTRYIFMLAASYYFYMCWNPKYAALILTTTIVTYLSGIFLERTSGRLQRKWIVAGSLLVNFGILFFFKYFDFALANINAVISSLGLELIEKPFDVLLPVGISFYTFQALSYTLDAYRGDVAVEHNFLKYALFISFFPQLVAGPIERSTNLLSQVSSFEKVRWDFERVKTGLKQMLWGFFLKMVIADRAAVFVETAFRNYWDIGSLELIAGAALFAIQIYCDFASYSIIAIGAARVFDVKLMENFDAPYLSRSVAEFWRRWHISLSTWFRDYLYIPLGGSRCSKWRNAFNIMVTFVVSGLWHGASWNYVVWGGIHGLYQVASRLTEKARLRLSGRLGINRSALSWRLLQSAVTFVLVDFAWIFFRAENLQSAVGYISRIFTQFDPWAISDGSFFNCGLSQYQFAVLAAAVAILFLVDHLSVIKKKPLHELLDSQNLWLRWGVYIAIIVFIFRFGVYGPEFSPVQFIYFQF